MKKLMLLVGLSAIAACSPAREASKYVCWTESVSDLDANKLPGGASATSLIREVCVPLSEYTSNNSYPSLKDDKPRLQNDDDRDPNSVSGSDSSSGEGTDSTNSETEPSVNSGVDPDFEESTAGNGEATAVEVNENGDVEASVASAGNGAAAQEGDSTLSVNASDVRDNLRDQIMNRK